MRFSDYKRLGKISIQSRKKSTRNTVRGISFGLILIVSVLFLAFAVFMSFNAEVNEIRTMATFTLMSKNSYDTTPSEAAILDDDSNVRREGILSYAGLKRIKDNPSCQETLVSNLLYVSRDGGNKSIKYSLDGATAKTLGNMDGPDPGIRVCNLAESGGKIILDAELHDLGGISAAYKAGGGFTMDADGVSGGKGEIILNYNIAEQIADGAGLDSLIGKKLSIEISGSMYNIYFDDNTDPTDTYTPSGQGNSVYSATIFTDFTIKGVLSKELTGLPSREDEVCMWVSEKSLYYTEDGVQKSLLPELKIAADTNNNSNSFIVSTYPKIFDDAQEFAAENQLILPAFGVFSYNESYGGYNIHSWNGEATFVTGLLAENKLQGESFQKAVALTAVITNELTPIFPGVESAQIASVYQSGAYNMFSMLFMALQIVMLVLFVFGGVLFITSMLNLYNSINYSVQARRNYLGMMRAIGAKDSSIPKMYFVEMFLIFMRTLVWVIVFSFGICFGLQQLLKLLMRDIGDSLMGVNLSLNLIYYPISLAAVYAVVFLIAVFFALTACKPVSKKPVLDVLRTDI